MPKKAENIFINRQIKDEIYTQLAVTMELEYQILPRLEISLSKA
jgi:hypothetical protein